MSFLCKEKQFVFFLRTYVPYAWVQESWYYVHSKYFIQYRSKAIMLSLA